MVLEGEKTKKKKKTAIGRNTQKWFIDTVRAAGKFDLTPSRVKF